MNVISTRYSYVDQNEAKQEHRPFIPKVEPKKMIRYRDNKIVSLKGERYTENDGELRKPTVTKRFCCAETSNFDILYVYHPSVYVCPNTDDS